ncbi:MAG: oligosaccharide flippase family protein [Symploca sp. SIO3E6]|nr:oligosaccharide flippase family protein [Caldora sp. SIO3E6]
MRLILKRLRQLLLKKDGFARNVTLLTSSTALAQALTIVASPVLTRLYTPEDFGILAVYTSLLSLLVVVGSWRYQLAIPIASNDLVAANVLALSVITLVIMTLLSGFAMGLLGSHIVTWTNAPELQPYLWLLPLGLIGAGMYQVLNYWAIRKQTFGYLAQTKLSQGLGQLITQLVLGLIDLRPLGLLVGDVVGRMAGSSRIATLAWKQSQTVFREISVPQMRSVASRYWRFPVLSGSSALLNSAGLQLPALLIAAFYGTQVAGWFALGQRIIGIPMALIGISVSQVYFSEAARLLQDNPEELRPFFFKTTRRLLAIGILPIGIIAMGGPWLFNLVFGKAWLEAGKYVQILALMFLVQFVVVPLSQTLNVLERQDLQLAWDASRLLLVIGSLQISTILELPARTALILYSIAMLFSYCCLFLLTSISLNQQVSRKL